MLVGIKMPLRMPLKTNLQASHLFSNQKLVFHEIFYSNANSRRWSNFLCRLFMLATQKKLLKVLSTTNFGLICFNGSFLVKEWNLLHPFMACFLLVLLLSTHILNNQHPCCLVLWWFLSAHTCCLAVFCLMGWYDDGDVLRDENSFLFSYSSSRCFVCSPFSFVLLPPSPNTVIQQIFRCVRFGCLPSLVDPIPVSTMSCRKAYCTENYDSHLTTTAAVMTRNNLIPAAAQLELKIESSNSTISMSSRRGTNPELL